MSIEQNHRHQWVPIAECPKLADGKYTACISVGGEKPFAFPFIGHWHNGWWSAGDFDPVELTHVLSPHLGPIPELP